MNIVDYLRSAQAELKKVSWPSKKDTIRYSVLVIAISVIVAVFFAVLDTGLAAGVTKILSNRNAPAIPTAPVVPDTSSIQVTPEVTPITPTSTP